MFEWLSNHAFALFNVLMIDLTLAGDNAIVIGMAASRVAPHIRAKVIFWGIAGAVILRIFFSGIAQQMMQVIGLTLAGGLLLLFVSWKMYRQIKDGEEQAAAELAGAGGAGGAGSGNVNFWPALWTIILADLSMSLDNVLAVAGAAGDSTAVLVIGLTVSIILMAIASNYIAGLLARHPWIAWVGLFIILYVALDMIYRDTHKVFCAAYGVGCSETILRGILHRLELIW